MHWQSLRPDIISDIASLKEVKKVAAKMPKVPLEEKVQVNSSVFTLPSEKKRIESFENVMIALHNDKGSADF